MMFSTASGVLSLVLVGCVVFPVTAQPAIVSEFDLKTVIDRLGDFDYGVQAEASGLVRRVPEDQARTALAVAVTDHEDEPSSRPGTPSGPLRNTLRFAE